MEVVPMAYHCEYCELLASGECDPCEFPLCDRFRDPGGESALHPGEGERTEPCPTCGQPNRLTKADVKHHYQCDECAARAEGTYIGGDY